MNIVSYSQIFKELLKADLLTIKPLVVDKLIDLFIWIATLVAVNTYVMPYFGLSTSYGVFILASSCASAGLFEVFPAIMQFVSDLEGERIIDYYLTLPIPSLLIFIRAIIYYAINAGLMGIMVLPMGKLLLWNLLDMQNINWLQYGLIFLASNFFYGALIIWTTSFVKNIMRIGSVWMRFIYPLWFLGCFQFSWQSLHNASPTLAYINLLNPMTYAAEGYRAASPRTAKITQFLDMLRHIIVIYIVCRIS
jgi:hypothetical protein